LRRIHTGGQGEEQPIAQLFTENAMTRLSSLSQYVETAFVVVISLVALAGIVRFIALAF